MNALIWAEAATNDLHRIRAYHADIDERIARDTIDRLVLSARWLTRQPLAGPALGHFDWRKWRPRRSRYLLIYRPVPNGIEIIRVRHEREDWWPVPQ